MREKWLKEIEDWFKDIPNGTYSFKGRWFKRYFVNKTDKVVEIYYNACDFWHPRPPLDWAKTRELKYIINHKSQILEKLRNEN